MQGRILVAAVMAFAASGCKSTLPETAGAELRNDTAAAPSAEVLAGFEQYCSGCHAHYVDDDGNTAWGAIAASAADVKRRLDWETTPQNEHMPPHRNRLYRQLGDDPTLRQAMLAAVTAAAAAGPVMEPSADYPDLQLPRGFKIAKWADVPGARSMTITPSGTVFVGTGGLGSAFRRVYAVQDRDGDGKAEVVKIIADGMHVPNGVAWKDGTLYIAEQNRIAKLVDIESRLDNPPAPIRLPLQLPNESSHGWKYLALGPDGKLYTHIGAPCNVCNPAQPGDAQNTAGFTTLIRFNTDGTGRELVAKGIRNSVGFAWHPDTKELWFTENGRDQLGDERPPDELNRVRALGLDFGFPYCHGNDIVDPSPALAALGTCDQAEKPALYLEPHAAALGLRFYTGDMFPAQYKSQLFIAERGSWNRNPPHGPRIKLVRMDATGTKALSHEDFIVGWQRANGSRFGRPVDVEQMADGSLLISDATAGVIYRVTYEGP